MKKKKYLGPLLEFRRYGSPRSHSSNSSSGPVAIQVEPAATERAKKIHKPWYTDGHVYQDKLEKPKKKKHVEDTIQSD